MGLDAWLYVSRNGKREELQYWRKYWELQDWVEKLWLEKGLSFSDEPNFNCVPVELTKRDLMQLKRDIKKDKVINSRLLPFSNDKGKQLKMETLAIINVAIEEYEEGNTIIYNSWW